MKDSDREMVKAFTLGERYVGTVNRGNLQSAFVPPSTQVYTEYDFVEMEIRLAALRDSRQTAITAVQGV